MPTRDDVWKDIDMVPHASNAIQQRKPRRSAADNFTKM